MGKVNKRKNHDKKNKTKNKSKDKRTDAAKFKVEKLKGNKDKKARSFAFAKYEKKKIQNQQFESIRNLNKKLDQIQGSVRDPKSDFERMNAPKKPVDISQAIAAISSL